MRERNLIPCIGQYMEKDTGRPTYIYGPYDPGRPMYQHELWTTDALWSFPLGTIKRWDDVDQEVRCDAESAFNGIRCYWELDTGEMTHTQVERRWGAYNAMNAANANLLLVVTCREGRLEKLRRRAKRVQNIALFTTLERIKTDPYGEIWTDFFGERAALPRSG